MFFETSIASKESIWHARGKKVEFVRPKLERESSVTEVVAVVVVVTFVHFTPDHEEHGSELMFHEMEVVWVWRSLERLIMVFFWVGDSSEETEVKRVMIVKWKRGEREKADLKLMTMVPIFMVSLFLASCWLLGLKQLGKRPKIQGGRSEKGGKRNKNEFWGEEEREREGVAECWRVGRGGIDWKKWATRLV